MKRDRRFLRFLTTRSLAYFKGRLKLGKLIAGSCSGNVSKSSPSVSLGPPGPGKAWGGNKVRGVKKFTFVKFKDFCMEMGWLA